MRSVTYRMLLALAVFACVPVSSTPAADDDDVVMSPADTSSPRATLESFIDACNELHDTILSSHYFDRNAPEHRAIARRVLDCIDDTELPEFARIQLSAETAVCIKEVLDRIELPAFDEIPDTDTIEAAGGVEELSLWRVPGARITIARVKSGPRKHEYLFSPGTVDRALSYYEQVKGLPYRTDGPRVSEGLYRWYVSSPREPVIAFIVDRLPDWARDEVGGQSIWKWMGLVVTVIVSLALMIVAYLLLRITATRFRDKSLLWYSLTIAIPIIAALIPIFFNRFVEYYLTLRGAHVLVVSFAADLIAFFASMVIVFGLCNRIAAFIIASPSINPQGLDAQFIRIVAKLLSLVISAVILLQGGQYLGIPVSTLLASAGIGGLAVALAAQDTLKNLFGTIMLLTDKPFRVGERIVFGKYDGIVEEIGLRSTRVRLLSGHQATIPNDELARNDIENVGRRPHIRRTADIHIPLNTPRKQIEQAVAIIRAALENHEGLNEDYPPRVFFFDFAPNAFTIRVIYWYSPPNYWDFLAFSERFNLQICRAFEEKGIQFSLPARLTFTSVESEQKPIEVQIRHDA
ncbi:MAG: mechanosensitive ion channel family protein [Pirellulaceae bacterium]